MKVFLFILILILSSNLLSLNAQTFLRGAFVNSGGHDSVEVQNQDSIKAAGFNAVVNRVHHPDIIYHPVDSTGDTTLNDNRLSFNILDVVLSSASTFHSVARLDVSDKIRAYSFNAFKEWEAEGNPVPNGDIENYMSVTINDSLNDHNISLIENNGEVRLIKLGVTDTSLSNIPAPNLINIFYGPAYFFDRNNVTRDRHYSYMLSEYAIETVIRSQNTVTNNVGIFRLTVYAVKKNILLANPKISKKDFTDLEVIFTHTITANKLTQSYELLPNNPATFNFTLPDSINGEPIINYCLTFVFSILPGYFDVADSLGDIFFDKFIIYDSQMGQLTYNYKDEDDFKNELYEFHSKYSLPEKLKYHVSFDEPSSLNNYTNLNRISRLMDEDSDFNGANITGKYYPGWSEYDAFGDDINIFEVWDKFIDHKNFMFYFFPVYELIDETRNSYYNLYRHLFHANENFPDFYYTAQVHGEKETEPLDNITNWRQPNAEQYSAMVHLALSFGAKGIFIEPFYTYKSSRGLFEGLYAVNSNGTEIVDYGPATDLLKKVKSINSRLAGILGQTLLNLKVNNTVRFFDNSFNLSDYGIIEESSYLSISRWEEDPHPPKLLLISAGILQHKTLTNKDYFYLVNFNPDPSHLVDTSFVLKFTAPSSHSYTFVNIENRSEHYSFQLSQGGTYSTVYHLGQGEGKLFRFGKTIEIGPILEDTDIIQNGESAMLEDTLIISAGGELHIYGTYEVDENIIVESGGKLNVYPTGKIKFNNGKSLIVKGGINISGELDFVNGDEITSNGIKVYPGSRIKIEGGKIKNAYSGIKAHRGFDSLRVTGTKFENCTLAAIYINGDNSSRAKLTGNKYENCGIGMYGLNLTNLTITSDTLIGESGYFLSNIGLLMLHNNTLTGVNGNSTGMFISSSYGTLLGNKISSFGTGILTGNSTISLGLNEITGNYTNGLYAGTDSWIEMGEYILEECDPPQFVPVMGMNKIYENGINQSEAEKGAEIMINESYINMEGGCNEIKDDRIGAEHLILIGGNSKEDINAAGNYWGTRLIETDRFSSELVVNHLPYTNMECTIIETGCVLSIIDTEGEEIDILQSAGSTMGDGDGWQELMAITFTERKDEIDATTDSVLTMESQIEITGGMVDMLYSNSVKRGNYSNYIKLENLYNSILNEEISDTILRTRRVKHKNNYLRTQTGDIQTSITQFTEVVNEYNGEERGLFGEIDLHTVSILESGGERTGSNAGNIKDLRELKNLQNKINKKLGLEKTPLSVITDYKLSQNYPNPVLTQVETNIEFEIPEKSIIEISLYNIQGREISKIALGEYETGRYKIGINTGKLASGVYIYRLQSQKTVITKKMVVIR